MLSLGVFVAIQYENESTLKCNFFAPLGFFSNKSRFGTRPDKSSSSVSFRWKASRYSGTSMSGIATLLSKLGFLAD